VGSAALLTLSLAVSHRAQVRCVVLVDPPWPVGDLPYVRRIVSNPSLPIEQVDTASDLPIGHPDVVSAVLRALAAADPGDRVRRTLSGLVQRTR
jgi:pimeloyl-ACP methyl ester carboxylesterase